MSQCIEYFKVVNCNLKLPLGQLPTDTTVFDTQLTVGEYQTLKLIGSKIGTAFFVRDIEIDTEYTGDINILDEQVMPNTTGTLLYCYCYEGGWDDGIGATQWTDGKEQTISLEDLAKRYVW